MDSQISIVYTAVQNALINAERGHDIWHALRVRHNAQLLANSEGGNIQIIEAAALIHDIADSKFYKGDERTALVQTNKILNSAGFLFDDIKHILQIVKYISFNGGIHNAPISTLEFKIVQDADRLDAIGAIGIARAFHYGGYKNREFYNPEIPPKEYASAEEYRNTESPTVNHFYEKLFKLQKMMNTQTAKNIARERHDFMELYLTHFYSEWGDVSMLNIPK